MENIRGKDGLSSSVFAANFTVQYTRILLGPVLN